MAEETAPMPKRLKITLIGTAAGKTCLMYAYEHGSFLREYIPGSRLCLVDKNVTCDTKTLPVHVWDTYGQVEYDKINALILSQRDCFLACFAIDSRHSLELLESPWIPFVWQHCPQVPLVLVGMKSDLRTELEPENLISAKKAEEMRKKINAETYLECSAISQENVDRSLEIAVALAVSKEKAKGQNTCKYFINQ